MLHDLNGEITFLNPLEVSVEKEKSVKVLISQKHN
jgi:hypothetical protein